MDAKELAREIRERAGGTIFACVFTKRTTGEERRMVCRLGVPPKTESPTHGRNYDPEEKGLLTVYDMQKRDYRNIPLEGVTSLTIRGKRYTALGEKTYGRA